MALTFTRSLFKLLMLCLPTRVLVPAHSTMLIASSWASHLEFIAATSASFVLPMQGVVRWTIDSWRLARLRYERNLKAVSRLSVGTTEEFCQL